MSTLRTSSGAISYVQEELARARNTADRVKRNIVRAISLVHASKARDHLYAVAGDVIYDMPRALIELERSLDAMAMIINRIDCEELKQVIRPEKVDELEAVLEEVRMHIPRRTGRMPFNVDLI
jgi:hypothetical protein